MIHHRPTFFSKRMLFGKKSCLAFSLVCVIALASCGGSVQRSLKKAPPPAASAEALQRGWQFVPEKFPSQGEQADQAVVYFHRDMAAFNCQAFNVNKKRSQGRLRVIKKAKNRKQGWRVIRLKGSSSWDPTKVVCDENTKPPYALGSDAQGKVADLGRGKPPPVPSASERERGWKFVDSSIRKKYETRTRTVPNPSYNPRVIGSPLTTTQTYRVQVGHIVTLSLYLYRPATVSCEVLQKFRGSVIGREEQGVRSSADVMGWFGFSYTFLASRDGLYDFPYGCQ